MAKNHYFYHAIPGTPSHKDYRSRQSRQQGSDSSSDALLSALSNNSGVATGASAPYGERTFGNLDMVGDILNMRSEAGSGYTDELLNDLGGSSDTKTRSGYNDIWSDVRKSKNTGYTNYIDEDFTVPSFGMYENYEVPNFTPGAGAGTAPKGAPGTGAPNPNTAPKSKLFKEGGFFNSENGLKGFYNKATNPQFDWNKKEGLTGWDKPLGKYVTAGTALYNGYKAAEALQDLSNSGDSTDELMAKISAASHNSPTIQYDLSSDQLDLLRDVRGGDYDTGISLQDVDLLGALGDAGMGVVMGASGGIPGMILGGLGGLTNSVLGDLNNTADARNTELEGLYQAILDSEQQYKQSRKQKAYARLGMGGY